MHDSKPLVNNNLEYKPKYVSAPVEKFAEELLMNGMEPDGSVPFVCNYDIVLPYDKPAGSPLNGGEGCIRPIRLPAPAPRLGRAGGRGCLDTPIWYPDYTSQQPSTLTSESVSLSGEDFSTFKLTPGFGESGFKCGNVKFMIACPEDIEHYKRFATNQCFRVSCPVCWYAWAAREANRAAERVRGFQRAFNRYNQPRHVSFSPPPRAIKSLNQLMDEARDVMKIAGVEAAAVIAHPYRLKHNDSDIILPGTWTNRYVEVLEKPSWRDFVRFSPHVHGIVAGPLMNAKEFQKETGWIYRNHDALSHSRSMNSTVYYLLTHQWANGNNKAVRYWFGMNTLSLGRVELEPEWKTEPCPKCKTDCVKVDVKQNPDTGDLEPWLLDPSRDLHQCEVYKRKVKRWEYVKRIGVNGNV